MVALGGLAVSYERGTPVLMVDLLVAMNHSLSQRRESRNLKPQRVVQEVQCKGGCGGNSRLVCKRRINQLCREHSKLRTCTVLGSYSGAMPRSIGAP